MDGRASELMRGGVARQRATVWLRLGPMCRTGRTRFRHRSHYQAFSSRSACHPLLFSPPHLLVRPHMFSCCSVSRSSLVLSC